MTRQPIRIAYEETGALRRPCPTCDAAPFQWCVDSRGRLRRVPCVTRTVERHLSQQTPGGWVTITAAPGPRPEPSSPDLSPKFFPHESASSKPPLKGRSR